MEWLADLPALTIVLLLAFFLARTGKEFGTLWFNHTQKQLETKDGQLEKAQKHAETLASDLHGIADALDRIDARQRSTAQGVETLQVAQQAELLDVATIRTTLETNYASLLQEFAKLAECKTLTADAIAETRQTIRAEFAAMRKHISEQVEAVKAVSEANGAAIAGIAIGAKAVKSKNETITKGTKNGDTG